MKQGFVLFCFVLFTLKKRIVIAMVTLALGISWGFNNQRGRNGPWLCFRPSALPADY